MSYVWNVSKPMNHMSASFTTSFSEFNNANLSLANILSSAGIIFLKLYFLPFHSHTCPRKNMRLEHHVLCACLIRQCWCFPKVAPKKKGCHMAIATIFTTTSDTKFYTKRWVRWGKRKKIMNLTCPENILWQIVPCAMRTTQFRWIILNNDTNRRKKKDKIPDYPKVISLNNYQLKTKHWVISVNRRWQTKQYASAAL